MRWSVSDRHYPSKLVNFRSALTIHAYLLTSDIKELQDVFPKMAINDVLDLSATFKVALTKY